ncbi:hypothetical protein ACQEU8_14835 [Streptomyces sp. CA-250714]|uniref:hypothetical protein n=1 Tax=Streptomyces sp. CA-250714 TaxID=3240060 RepID=UPI003D92C9EF
MARSEKQVAIEVSAASVLLGDEIQIGGQAMSVRDLVHLSGGCKRVTFASGETLIITPTTTLTVLRTAKGWDESC